MPGDLSDLLGEPRPLLKRGPGRPSNAQRAAEAEAQGDPAPMPHSSEFRKPVGISFIADVMGKYPKQIQKRLEKCPVAEWVQYKGKPQPMFDFMTAMSYLIPPKGDIEDWFSQQNQASLPPQVSKAFWESMNSRIRAMRAAGQLWHDDDVMALLGRVLMMIKGEMHNWIEEMPSKDILSNEQFNWMVDQTISMMTRVKNALVEAPKEFATQSLGYTIMDEINDAKLDEYEETPEG